MKSGASRSTPTPGETAANGPSAPETAIPSGMREPDTGNVVRPRVPERLPQAKWPEYWRSRLASTPPHPVVVWTYPALSRDLGGQADVKHSDFFRRLLKDMKMQRGTSAFWPLNPFPYGPNCDENTVDASMFMSGIDVLNPDMVVLMCGSAPRELGLGDLMPLMNVMIRGRYFVVTPQVDSLLDSPPRYNSLVTFLKGFLDRR